MPYVVFAITTLIGIIYFFVEGLYDPAVLTGGDAFLHALYSTVVTITTIGACVGACLLAYVRRACVRACVAVNLADGRRRRHGCLRPVHWLAG